jgi:aspartokinase/homoserine dehydrogenase 1
MNSSSLKDSSTVYIVLIGMGVVGEVFLRTVAALSNAAERRFVLIGVSTSKQMIWNDSSGLSWTLTRDQLTESASVDVLCERIVKLSASKLKDPLVVVDATADDTWPLKYNHLLASSSVLIVTPNKRAGVLPLPLFRRLADDNQWTRRVGVEATVMAGLPVISTLRDLIRTGDAIRSIEGVFSGTLAFVFDRLAAGTPFSAAVREARALGYTEPDPRDDLCGADVARKLLILARECGAELELRDVQVESLVPSSIAASANVEEFLVALEAFDGEWQRRSAAASSQGGARLAFVARFDAASRKCECRAEASTKFDALATDNIVLFTTQRYAKRPLIVQGPGAGPEVTSAGILSDIFRLVSVQL